MSSWTSLIYFCSACTAEALGQSKTVEGRASIALHIGPDQVCTIHIASPSTQHQHRHSISTDIPKDHYMHRKSSSTLGLKPKEPGIKVRVDTPHQNNKLRSPVIESKEVMITLVQLHGKALCNLYTIQAIFS